MTPGGDAHIWTRAPRLEVWKSWCPHQKSKDRVEIGIVGKYLDLR